LKSVIPAVNTKYTGNVYRRRATSEPSQRLGIIHIQIMRRIAARKLIMSSLFQRTSQQIH